VPKSLVSSARLTSSLLCRNRANSPCGSSMTWVNCARVRPTSSAISSPASALFADTLAQAAPSRRCRWTRLASVVNPSPRFFGRRYSGLRVTWYRTPRSDHCSSTSVRASGAAKCERSLSSAESAPARPPYRANVTASRIVLLPAPVGPSSRNSPPWASRSKSTTCSAA